MNVAFDGMTWTLYVSLCRRLSLRPTLEDLKARGIIKSKSSPTVPSSCKKEFIN